VTVDDIQQVAKKYVKPEAARIIVVGDKEEAQKLKRFSADGKINYYDSYGKQIESPFVGSNTTAQDGKPSTDKYNYDMPTGEKATPQLILDKYAAAVGGKKAIESIKSMVTEGSFSMQGM